MRPRQWIKNLIIFAGLIFAQKLFDLHLFLTALAAFVLFCVITGCIYLINDLKDLKQDQSHPQKKSRPLAGGRLSSRAAIVFTAGMLPLALLLSLVLSLKFGIIALVYAFLMLGYTFGLKNVVILDALIIAAGFVLRGIAGIVVIGVAMSPWFFICASLLALFIVFCKRRNELIIMDQEAVKHKRVLTRYTRKVLDVLILLVTLATVISYFWYTLAPETVAKFNTQNLVYTVPFVLLGLFRYLYLVYHKGKGGRPEKLLMTDGYLMFDIVLWLAVVFFVLYGSRSFS